MSSSNSVFKTFENHSILFDYYSSYYNYTFDTYIEYEEAPNSARLRVGIKNAGDKPSYTLYLVTVTDCTAPMDPVLPQMRVLGQKECVELSFDLYCSEGFTEGDTCKVALKSPTGMVYDDCVVTFPPIP